VGEPDGDGLPALARERLGGEAEAVGGEEEGQDAAESLASTIGITSRRMMPGAVKPKISRRGAGLSTLIRSATGASGEH
jgi:hypothetical protein